MNKLSKKIVALVTMMLFVVTMMPFAAFAADDKASVTGSYFVTSDANEDNDNVDIDETVGVEFEINNTKDQPAQDTLKHVVVWAVDANGNVTDAATFSGADGDSTIANTACYAEVADGKAVTVSFQRAGTYKIYAGVDETTNKDAEKVGDLTRLSSDANNQTIVVKKDEADTKYMKIGDAVVTDKLSSTATIDLGIVSNGVAQKKLDVVVYDENDEVVKNTEVTISTSSSKLTSNKASEKTDRSGKFSFKLSASKSDEYKVYLETEDGFKGVLKVTTDGLTPNSIKTIKTPSNAFDKDTNFKYSDALEDDVQFEIADAKGAVISGYIWDEPAFDKDADGHKDYVKVVDQPDSMDLDGEDFELVPVEEENGDGYEDYYTLVFTGANANKLKEGKYTVKVALKNGDTAQVTFEVAKFGTATALEINFDTESVALGSENNHPDSVKVVDANGVSRNVKDSDDVTFGYNGYAVLAKSFDADGESFSFDVSNDEKYLGSKITFTAVSEDLGLVGTASVTVQADGQSIEFDKTSGPANDDNDVIAQVVDGEGKTVSVNTPATVTAYVASQSNADAKVSVDVTKKSDLEKKGQTTLTVSSDKEGTAEIVVVITDSAKKVYANTLTYTFGKAAPDAGADSFDVVMVIGSTETIVDNQVVTIDAVPFISQNRTFVPIRALAEDFGAEVAWDGDAQKVTITLDGNVVEMTIGSTTYTVNGAEKTMDVAPMIRSDRTFVPVRFAAEALGFNVTPTYNPDGTTASVVFSK